jgi:hypothetical protein
MRDWCIWLVDSFECILIHGLANPKICCLLLRLHRPNMSSKRIYARELRIKYFSPLLACLLHEFVGRGSAVGIAIRYGLEGLEIESQLGRDLSHLCRPTQPASCEVGTGSFSGRGSNYSPSSSAGDKESVELYHYCPAVASWQARG